MSIEDLYKEYPHLNSERLTLKKIEESDIDDMFEIYSNDNLFLYRPGKVRKNKETVKNMIGHFLRDFNKQKMIFLGIYLKNGKLIGIGEIFDHNRRVNSITVGYTLNEEYWGCGYATEATKAMISFLFERVGINRIQAFVMPENIKSKEVLLRGGFQKEGTIREGDFWKDVGVIDLELYSILRGEYGL
ncbi:MAG: GNAT family N-acetyltransferase [Spirochaetales bacterium]|nr:GNAT family N-acetyltransferase [Spirochaetales bacterium]